MRFTICNNRGLLLLLLLFSISFCTSSAEKKLKILFVIDKFPYEPRWYINNQITGLLDEGHEVYILADRVGQIASYPEVQKYQLLEKTFYGSLPKSLTSFDIILCQFGGKGIYAMKRIKMGVLKGKLVVCFRGGDTTHRLVENPHRYDELFKHVDLCLPNCIHFKNVLISHGCHPSKIEALYSGIDTSRFTFHERKMPGKDEKIKIITVARLFEYKGIGYAIRAVRRVLKQFPTIEYEIIGDGPERDNLQKMIHAKGLEKNIKLSGYLPQAEVIKRLDESHLFLFTPFTTAEGEQDAPVNVIKEALATGLPVIATRHGGIPELIEDGVTGLLVEEKNVDQMAEKIIHFFQHPGIWSPLAVSGAEHIQKKFDKNVVNKRLIDICLELKIGKSGVRQ